MDERAIAACAVTKMLLKRASGVGDLNMFDIAQVVLFILECAFLFGLTLFLFRDQLTSRRHRTPPEALEPPGR